MTETPRGLIPCRAPVRLADLGIAAVEYFAQRLGITTPDVRWFFDLRDLDGGPTTAPLTAGCTVPGSGVVWVNVHQSPLQAWRTIGHEAAHVAGFGEGRAVAFESQAHVSASYFRWAATNLGAA